MPLSTSKRSFFSWVYSYEYEMVAEVWYFKAISLILYVWQGQGLAGAHLRAPGCLQRLGLLLLPLAQRLHDTIHGLFQDAHADHALLLRRCHRPRPRPCPRALFLHSVGVGWHSAHNA